MLVLFCQWHKARHKVEIKFWCSSGPGAVLVWSRLEEATSGLQPPRLPASTFSLEVASSKLKESTSRLQPPRLQAPTFSLEVASSRPKEAASRLQAPTSSLEVASSRLKEVTSK